MNQGHGILVFGFCFFAFLTWLWRHSGTEEVAAVDSSSGSKPDLGGVSMDTLYKEGEVDNWLSENQLEALQSYVRTAGMLAKLGSLLV